MEDTIRSSSNSISYPRLILKMLILTWILVGLPDAGSSQLSTMDISPGEIVCPGKEILFTCVSRDTGIITWTSGEYVGNPIDFISRDTPGETREGSVDQNTIATLIDSSIEQGTIPVLVSTLQITVSSVSLTPSVTCIHSRSENFTFQVLDVPAGVPQVPVMAEYAMGSCALNISWTAPDNIVLSDITNFIIYVDGRNIRNSTSLSVLHSVSSCGSHNVSVSAVDRCNRQGRPSANETICKCMVDDNDNSAGNPSTVAVIIGVVVGVVVVVVLPIIIVGIVAIALIAVSFIKKRRERKITPSPSGTPMNENSPVNEKEKETQT